MLAVATGERIEIALVTDAPRRCPRVRVMDVKTKETRTLPRPIIRVESRTENAITRRFLHVIQRMRTGLRLRPRLSTPCPSQKGPRGFRRVENDMNTRVFSDLFIGHAAPFLTVARRAADQWHYFNHLLISPDASRFIVLHRWPTEHR